MKKDNEINEEILERLDIVVKLLALNALPPNATQTESICRLDKIGLKPKQIAEVLNNTQNYVNMILSRTRKEEK